MSTIQAIADSTGLSANTVSRLLRGRIKGQRRDAIERSRLVLEAAERVGYRPNSSARAMKTGSFGAIGLVQSADPQRSRLEEGVLAGIHEAIRAAGLHLVSSRLPDERLINRGFVPKILRELMVDGLIVNYDVLIPSAMLELLRDNAIPSVWLNVEQDFNCVRPDDRQAGQIATEHLIRAGHRRIAYAALLHSESFIFSDRSHYSQRARYAGYADAMRDAGLEPKLIAAPERGPRSEMAPTPAVRLDWLDAKDRPTALVSYSSWGLYRVAMTANHKCGSADAIAMVTFGEAPQQTDDLSFDTVVLPLQQIGLDAVSMLQQRMADPRQSVPTRVVPCTLHLADRSKSEQRT
jgi:LacI family transcriptional regulator